MTGQGADSVTPGIRIDVGPAGVTVQQQRPALVSSLTGMAAPAALRLVPLMLPVCGRAQAVAARRAVAAAQGDIRPSFQDPIELLLWREQAFAAAWRYCVDWPDLLGEARRMTELAAVRGATNDPECGQRLAQMIAGVDRVENVDQLLDWVRSSDTVAAGLAVLALEAGDESHGDNCLAGDAMVETAAAAFSRRPFNPLSPWDTPLEVGPLAMARDPLIATLQAQLGSSTASRILAQVLDTRVICRQLAGTGAGAEGEVNGWLLEAGIGMGRAVTSRGPVFHRVALQGGNGDRVADWRVLAPTDWHFALRGPVVAGLEQTRNAERMRLLVTSYDPCAPWSLHCNQAGG